MKFRKKPVVIEAMQWDGKAETAEEIVVWSNNAVTYWPDPIHPKMEIYTLEGYLSVTIGDWVIKGVKGEFYPCKPDIFDATYEVVK